ncbi:MAG: hypothetical protein Q8M29_09925 [Bacteroidota bacterium]|nr:hypothetical protein [Bacteroidota bacterium]
MKKGAHIFLIILSISTFLFSCTNAEEVEVTKNEKMENLGFEDMPNSETKSITIETKNTADQLELITKLRAKLEEDDFDFEQQEVTRFPGFSNCEENTTISITGNGLRQYFARSRKPEKNTTDFYPDFIIQVFEFQNEQIAQEKFEIMHKAMHSKGRFCNGKAPMVLVINNNEVFYFFTRAEMFRGYINEYSEFVEML